MPMRLWQEVQALPRGAGRRVALSRGTGKSSRACSTLNSFGRFNFLTKRGSRKRRHHSKPGPRLDPTRLPLTDLRPKIDFRIPAHRIVGGHAPTSTAANSKLTFYPDRSMGPIRFPGAIKLHAIRIARPAGKRQCASWVQTLIDNQWGDVLIVTAVRSSSRPHLAHMLPNGRGPHQIRGTARRPLFSAEAFGG
jgi:hypothetical protein